MSFKYPEVNKTTTNDLETNNWDSQCSSWELLKDNINYKNKKKPNQSPININTNTTQECGMLCNLEIYYKPSKCTIDKYEDNLIRIIHDKGSFIKYGKNMYELKYVFFHTPSNHLINGKNFDMEINFYHGYTDDLDQETYKAKQKIKTQNKHNNNHYHAHTDDKDDTNLNGRKNGVVLSVMVNVKKENETKATKPNIFLSQFIHTDDFRDLKLNEDPIIIDVGKKWNVKQLLPDNLGFYNYDGSIAMPPCTEKYSWIIFENNIEIIPEYLEMLRHLGNPLGNRSTHPLNGRVVFYNPNVKIKEEKLKPEDKNTFVNNKLSPIRILYNNRSGNEYIAKAKYVIDRYSGGENSGWRDNKTKLKKIVNDWDSISKIGYKDIIVDDIDLTKEDDYKDLVFNYYEYNDFRYPDYIKSYKDTSTAPPIDIPDAINKLFNIDSKYIDLFNFLNKNGNIFKKLSEYIDSNTNPGYCTNYTQFEANFKTPGMKKFVEKYFKYTNSDDIETKLTDGEIASFFEKLGTDKALNYLLICWDKENFPDIYNLYDFLDNDDKVEVLRKNIIKQIITVLKDTKSETEAKYLIFKKKKNSLINTLDGDDCQEWGSNEVHYEGDLTKFWRKSVSFPGGDGLKFEEMGSKEREMGKDGLLKFDGNKFIRHNECRNPENREGAPWCYTTNPKVRWQYCAIPDHSTNYKTYILTSVVIMIIMLSIFLVKVIFKYEFFSKFVASITGGGIISQGVFTANQAVSNVRGNISQ